MKGVPAVGEAEGQIVWKGSRKEKEGNSGVKMSRFRSHCKNPPQIQRPLSETYLVVEKMCALEELLKPVNALIKSYFPFIEHRLCTRRRLPAFTHID